LQHLLEAFQSIREYQKKDPFCKDFYPKVVQANPAARNFKLFNEALVHHPSQASTKRYVLPELLRPMVFQYFHGSTLRAHLGVNKTLSRIGKVFYCPRMRSEVCKFVRGYPEYQRAKPVQDSRLRLHSIEVVMRPMERVFIDILGTLSEVGGRT
jgi:hypothetical protein